ncbi:hypothetical protein HJG60_010528 [Phyllostomus discolor]|uniref:Uncharacterized protein n=1 Tax=Phyllostomus discolor TaxID=89673 RepID=A0A834APG7_9CHIR|nr:hypothetical protein HJG60_010528 [Phyllostomus discolor]
MKQNCPKRGNAPRMGLTLTRAHRHTHTAHSHAGQTRDLATLPELNDSVWFLSLAMCMCINAADWDLSVNFNWSTRPWSIVQQEISSTKLCKPLLTSSISHGTFSIRCTNLFFFGISVAFVSFLK